MPAHNASLEVMATLETEARATLSLVAVMNTQNIYNDTFFLFLGATIWVLALLLLFILIPRYFLKRTRAFLKTNTDADLDESDTGFYVRIALIVLLGIIFAEFKPISSTLARIFDPSPPSKDGLFEIEDKLGDAIMIAGLITLGVDRYMKRKLLGEVARDVLSFAAGHDLPPELKRRVSTLIRVPYYRNDFTIQLTPTILNNGFVRIMMTTTYSVQNLTDMTPDYPVRTAIEQSLNKNEPSQLLEMKLSGSENLCISANDLPKWNAQNQNDAYLAYEHSTQLLPAGGTALTVRTKRSSVYPENWYYILDILDTTANCAIITDDLVNFDWGVEVPLGHTRGDRQGSNWPCPGVYLPGQFVRISWARK
jgi:hypothetical protein